LSDVPRTECYRRYCSAPTDPETRIAVARTTVATQHCATRALRAVLPRLLRAGVAARHSRPSPPPLASRTSGANPPPPGRSRAPARRVASPTKSVRLSRRSCRGRRPLAHAAPLPTIPLTTLPPGYAGPDRSVQAQPASAPVRAARADQLSHWASAAALPARRNWPAPCSSASGLAGNPSTLSPAAHSLRSLPNRPLTACPQAHLPGPALTPRAHRRVH